MSRYKGQKGGRICRAGKWLLRHWQSPYSPVFVWGCFKWSSVSVTAMHLCGFALIHPLSKLHHKLYQHLPQGTGQCWRAWKRRLVPQWLWLERTYCLKLKRNRGQILFMGQNDGQRFQFRTDSNSHGLYQRFGESRPVLFIWLFSESLVLQCIFFLLTEQLLPFLCWVSFSVKVQIQASLNQAVHRGLAVYF